MLNRGLSFLLYLAVTIIFVVCQTVNILFLNLIGMLMLPIACAIIHSKYGNMKMGITAVIDVAVAIVLTKFNIDIAFSVFCYALIGFLVSFLGRKENGIIAVISAVGAVYVLMIAVSLLLSNGFDGLQNIMQGIENFKDDYRTVFEQAVLNSEMADYSAVFMQYVDMVLNFVINISPAIAIILISAVSYFITALCELGLKLAKCDSYIKVEFSKFKIDTVTSMAFVVSLIAALVLKDGVIFVVFVNIYTIIQFFLLICALSIVDFYLKKNKVPLVFRIILIFIAAVLSTIPVVNVILSIIALSDCRRDYRNLTGNRRYIGLVNGKPAILTQEQYEELLKKTKEKEKQPEEDESKEDQDNENNDK